MGSTLTCPVGSGLKVTEGSGVPSLMNQSWYAFPGSSWRIRDPCRIGTVAVPIPEELNVRVRVPAGGELEELDARLEDPIQRRVPRHQHRIRRTSQLGGAVQPIPNVRAAGRRVDISVEPEPDDGEQARSQGAPRHRIVAPRNADASSACSPRPAPARAGLRSARPPAPPAPGARRRRGTPPPRAAPPARTPGYASNSRLSSGDSAPSA